MFLNESTFRNTTRNRVPNIAGDAATGLNIVLEAEQAWNDISMKMVRLEHVAIVNNDRQLLSEGGKEFLAKAKQWFKDLYEKIKAFVAKVIANIIEFITKFAKVQKSYPEVADVRKTDAKVKVHPKLETLLSGGVANIAKEADKLTLNINQPDNIIRGVERFIDKHKDLMDAEKKELPVKKLYASAKVYMEKPGTRKMAIKSLKKLEQSAKLACDAGIKKANEQYRALDEKNKSAKEERKTTVSDYKKTLTSIQRSIVSLSRVVNTTTIQAFQVMNKGKSAAKKNKKEADKKAKKESNGILDQFGL